MADDLMDFSEAEMQEASLVLEQDENDIPRAPGLVQSPVIVNSILKQSTKDNLIQLYTPVQKPEKGRLKVHFGHDSLLQTPNVNQVKKRQEGVATIKEETEVKINGVKFVGDDKENVAVEPELTDVTTNSTSETSGVEVTPHSVEEVIHQIPVKDEADKSSVDSALDYSAMEVSICETETSEKTVDPANDIILQAEMLLRSLQGASAVQTEVSEKIQVSDETAYEDSPKETDEKNDTETAAVKVEMGISNIDQESQAGIANITEEEPMECEEAIVVDEEDDEIVFNLDKNKKHENTDENVSVKVETEEVKIPGEFVGEVKTGDVEKIESEKKDSPNLKNNIMKTTQDSLNNIENGAKDTVFNEEETKENNEEYVTESVETAKIKDVAAVNIQKTSTLVESELAVVNGSKGTDSKKTGGDSSDEEFLSADEDMVDIEVKTPAKASDIDSDNQQVNNKEHKQDSPERTPPKVGYNLNFDDLDSMDPFATKKGLVNSPDVEKPPKQLIKNDEDRKEKESELSVGASDYAAQKVNDTGGKNEIFKSANTSPEKSAPPPKAEIILSPNAVLVDEVCKDKTAGDIFEEKPDCLLSDHDVKQIDHAESLQKGECNLNPAEFGAKKELDFDNIDPFKPTVQIVNTPDKSKEEVKQINTEEPLKTLEQKVNTPQKPEIKDKFEDSQGEASKSVETAENADTQTPVEEQLKTEKGVAFTPEKEDVENRQVEPSPQIPVTKGTYNLDALDLDDIDPFKPSKQMSNSPSTNSDVNANDEVDPFKPKMQIQNSPISRKNCETKPEEGDPFKPKKQIMNSSVFEKGIVEDTKDNSNADQQEDVDDPFKPKSQIKNSPAKTPEDIPVEENDPFKPKTQILNSPAIKVSSGSDDSSNLEGLDIIDPFKPKSQIQNSPAGKIADTINSLESENFDDIDPFKSKSQLMNSPVGKVKEVEHDLDAVENPFQPRNQMQNSPQIKESKCKISTAEPKSTEDSDKKVDSTEHVPNECADVDPFTSTKQLKMSPPAKSEPKVDPFADLNPFETKSKVAKTPEKAEQKGLNDFDNIDPFKSNIKIPNSPDLKTPEDNPFVTKSRIANTPTKEEDNLFTEKVHLPTTPVKESEEEADQLGEIFEVQGVTRRGHDSQQNQLGDIDESQFVSASQVFNDPAAWEMLEKLGSATSDTAESALSRMSLYVKFDPLVDEAPAVNPRRISIRVSQLEKVKEYGLDETLLLLGTPPKKRRQSMLAAQARVTPGGTKTLSSAAAVPPSDKKTEPATVAPGAVDLILAYSPTEKEQAQKCGIVSNAPVMSLLDDMDTPEESENLFQELKYTDADLKRFQRDNKLAMQGMLINKDKEWCKKEKQWEQKYAELTKKNKQIIQDRDKLEQAFLSLEQTVYQIAAARDASEKKVEELTNEKEQALQDIQAVETAFSDLHRRYEKAKTMIMSMKKNEETLKKHAVESQEKHKKMNEKFHMFEKSSQEKLAANKLEIEKLEQQRDSVQSKFDAQMKIMQMKIENLETSLQRKTEENKQLTEICDNLLNKVGQ